LAGFHKLRRKRRVPSLENFDALLAQGQHSDSE
jgi:hypothetical protein